MTSPEFDEHPDYTPTPGWVKGTVIGLSAGLVLALAGDAYLLKRSQGADERIGQVQADTQSQISKLNDATSELLHQRLKALNDELTAAMKGANASTTSALRRAQSDAQKQAQQLAAELQNQQQQVSTQLGELKEATQTADSRISAVSTDVTGVKTEVTSVKDEVATAKSGLEKAVADLRRMTGDMGVMSGLIATNGKDLAALRELGERNYTEFNLTKKQSDKRVGNIVMKLKNADMKRNRFTLEVFADDKRVEKKDRTINEPVQVYVGGNRQPYEIVINQVKKDEVVGYLSAPKVTTLARN